MTTGTKQIAIGDFMTGAMLKSASRIVLASKDPGEAVARIALEVIAPNLEWINTSLGQENDARYLAYAVVWAMGEAARASS